MLTIEHAKRHSNRTHRNWILWWASTALVLDNLPKKANRRSNSHGAKHAPTKIKTLFRIPATAMHLWTSCPNFSFVDFGEHTNFFRPIRATPWTERYSRKIDKWNYYGDDSLYSSANIPQSGPTKNQSVREILQALSQTKKHEKNCLKFQKRHQRSTRLESNCENLGSIKAPNIQLQTEMFPEQNVECLFEPGWRDVLDR